MGCHPLVLSVVAIIVMEEKKLVECLHERQ